MTFSAAAVIEIREVSSPQQLRRCEQLQRAVWDGDDLGVTPVHFFVASVHAGGLVLGAFENEEMIGFLNGFPAHRPDNYQPLGLHSDMMAVLPSHRGRGIGRQLKWRQRAWCLAKDLPWISWTFDPLQAKNARLNLEYLGATVREYAINRYGPLDGPLNAGLPTDRLVAHWNLTSARVQRLARGEPLGLVDVSALPCALGADEGKPQAPQLELDAPQLTVTVPTDLNGLLKNNLPLALSWRERVRMALRYYLIRGYEIRRFVDNYLILVKLK